MIRIGRQFSGSTRAPQRWMQRDESVTMNSLKPTKMLEKEKKRIESQGLADFFATRCGQKFLLGRQNRIKSSSDTQRATLSTSIRKVDGLRVWLRIDARPVVNIRVDADATHPSFPLADRRQPRLLNGPNWLESDRRKSELLTHMAIGQQPKRCKTYQYDGLGSPSDTLHLPRRNNQQFKHRNLLITKCTRLECNSWPRRVSRWWVFD